MSEELKSCPRCGAEAHVVTEDGEPTMFLCEDCGCWLDVSEFETTENAFKWWNDRPFIDALNARIAELEAENTALKQHSQPIEFWSDEKKELYRRNESRTIKSGREEERER